LGISDSFLGKSFSADESPVSFASFSVVKDRKLRAPIFARQMACAVAQHKLVLTQADQGKIKRQWCGEF
jgi:hypothetical protein